MTPERLAEIGALFARTSRAEAITGGGWQSPTTLAAGELLAELARVRQHADYWLEEVRRMYEAHPNGGQKHSEADMLRTCALIVRDYR